ncbi:hypothetical protein, partial [Streptomyces sp. NPDC056405]|uniref:hypothetical protein n=1 Tax=Streptomyces sp. NPDC056405 TaxID=3345811 RepID=UPI0035DB136B
MVERTRRIGDFAVLLAPAQDNTTKPAAWITEARSAPPRRLRTLPLLHPAQLTTTQRHHWLRNRAVERTRPEMPAAFDEGGHSLDEFPT